MSFSGRSWTRRSISARLNVRRVTGGLCSAAVVVQWARDSAYRFFPLVRHDNLGLVLHPFNLATNKVLALVDTLSCDCELQPRRHPRAGGTEQPVLGGRVGGSRLRRPAAERRRALAPVAHGTASGARGGVTAAARAVGTGGARPDGHPVSWRPLRAPQGVGLGRVALPRGPHPRRVPPHRQTAIHSRPKPPTTAPSNARATC